MGSLLARVLMKTGAAPTGVVFTKAQPCCCSISVRILAHQPWTAVAQQQRSKQQQSRLCRCSRPCRCGALPSRPGAGALPICQRAGALPICPRAGALPSRPTAGALHKESTQSYSVMSQDCCCNCVHPGSTWVDVWPARKAAVNPT